MRESHRKMYNLDGTLTLFTVFAHILGFIYTNKAITLQKEKNSEGFFFFFYKNHKFSTTQSLDLQKYYLHFPKAMIFYLSYNHCRAKWFKLDNSLLKSHFSFEQATLCIHHARSK